MTFRLCTQSSLSVREVSVESLQSSSASFINDLNTGGNIANVVEDFDLFRF